MPLFKCNDCRYTSTRTFNIKSHIKRIHSRDATDNELQNLMDNYEIVAENNNDVALIDISNVNGALSNRIGAENNRIGAENYGIVAENWRKNKNCLKCQKCVKSFSTKQWLKKHEEKCKGISNVLECHFCHKVLANRHSKSHHHKICKMKAVLEATDIIQNNIQNNMQNNLNIIYINNNDRNANTLYYSDDEKYNEMTINEFGSENIEYISNEEMDKLTISRDIKTLIELIFYNKEHPENHNIRRGDMRYKYVKIFLNKEWKYELLNIVVKKMYEKAHNILDMKLIFNKVNDHTEKTKKLIDKILEEQKKDCINFLKMKFIVMVEKKNKALILKQ